jgi:hypothetical protein
LGYFTDNVTANSMPRAGGLPKVVSKWEKNWGAYNKLFEITAKTGLAAT